MKTCKKCKFDIRPPPVIGLGKFKIKGKPCPYFDKLYESKREKLIKVLTKHNNCVSNGINELDLCIEEALKKGVPEKEPTSIYAALAIFFGILAGGIVITVVVYFTFFHGK